MMSIIHTDTQTDAKSERVPYLAKLGEKIVEVGRQDESRSVTHLIRIYIYIHIHIYYICIYHPKTVTTPLKEEHFISNLINSYKGYAYRKIRRQKTASFRKEDKKEKTI